MNQTRYAELKQAERGAILSIVAYIFVSIAKLAIGRLANSEGLWADGLNNATDIVASIAVLIGLRLAQKPADEDQIWTLESRKCGESRNILDYAGGWSAGFMVLHSNNSTR